MAMRSEMDQMPIASQPQHPQQAPLFLLVPADCDYRGMSQVSHSTASKAHALNYPMAVWSHPLPAASGGALSVSPVGEKPMGLLINSERNSPNVTPRTELPTDERYESDQPERPRITASTARRLRRKRAAEKVKTAQTRELLVPHLDDFRALLKRDADAAIFQVKGHVLVWSQNEVGCRLVQDILELGTRDAAELATELRGHVLEAVTCPHANYVIQKVVSHLSTASSAFVAQDFSCRREA